MAMEVVDGQYTGRVLLMKVSKDVMLVQGCYQWLIEEETPIQVNFL